MYKRQETIFAIQKDTDLSEIDGIIYKKEGNIIKNKARVALKNLDKLPQPAWDLIDINQYKKIWNSGKQEFTLNLATTRGCPFKCNWCAKPIYGNRYNSHSPKYIIEQIKYLKENHESNVPKQQQVNLMELIASIIWVENSF